MSVVYGAKWPFYSCDRLYWIYWIYVMSKIQGPKRSFLLRCECMTWNEIKMKMICERNFNGEFSGELCWEMVQQLHVGGAHELFWKVLQHICLRG